MAEKDAPLAASCRQCAFFQAPASRCRRHAPGIGSEEMELTYWPLVKPADRCGAGQTVDDGTETTACGRCIHWVQPDGVGIRPDYRQGLGVEWWEKSGYCTRFAPVPNNDEEKRSFWRCTHASDRCGDGEEAEVDDPGPDLLGELAT
jgi:hypothetical protein